MGDEVDKKRRSSVSKAAAMLGAEATAAAEASVGDETAMKRKSSIDKATAMLGGEALSAATTSASCTGGSTSKAMAKLGTDAKV